MQKSFTPHHFFRYRFSHKNPTKSGAGFTLIELLVVTGIIILLSGIALVSYRPGQSQLALQRSANKLTQDIRRVQEMAMSAKEYQGKVPPGYGVYLNQGNNYFLIYADTNPAQGNEIYDGGDGIVETIYFEKNVYIKNLSPASLSINFKPPDPKTKISGTGISEANSATITISLETDPSKEKRIIVNKAGLIYVE